MVLGQEEADSCRRLLELSGGAVTLCIPAISLLEPHFTLKQRQKDRALLASRIEEEARQLQRSEHYREGPFTPLRDIKQELDSLAEHFEQTYDQISEGVRTSAKVLLLEHATLERATLLQRQEHFQRIDAIILASILIDLEIQSPRPACFVTVDKAFAVRASQLLDQMGARCVVKSRFSDALQYVTHPR